MEGFKSFGAENCSLN